MLSLAKMLGRGSACWTGMSELPCLLGWLLQIRPIYPLFYRSWRLFFNPDDELRVCVRALEASTAAAGSRAPNPGVCDEVNRFAGAVTVRGRALS